jgi:DNA-binding LytR/AlgR family response regulator
MSVIFVHNLKVVSFIDKMDPNFEKRLFSALDVVRDEMLLTKPLTNKRIEPEKILQYKYKTQLYRIPHADIVAVETNAIKRGLVITTTYNTYQCNMSLKVISDELSDSFVQSHRSILINTDRVSGVKNKNAQYYALMDTDQEYPVSQKYVKQVFSKLTNSVGQS